jgi:hypothetical protein
LDASWALYSRSRALTETVHRYIFDIDRLMSAIEGGDALICQAGGGQTDSFATHSGSRNTVKAADSAYIWPNIFEFFSDWGEPTPRNEQGISQ